MLIVGTLVAVGATLLTEEKEVNIRISAIEHLITPKSSSSSWVASNNTDLCIKSQYTTRSLYRVDNYRKQRHTGAINLYG